MPTLVCQACGTPVPLDEPIPRDSECEGCRRDLRCCMNCRHYDPRMNNSCRETEADVVEDKARRNFCEFFAFNRAAFQAGAGTNSKEAEARAKLAAMFGGTADSTEARPSDTARQKLENLFGGSAGPKPDRAAEAKKKLDALFRKPADDEE